MSWIIWWAPDPMTSVLIRVRQSGDFDRHTRRKTDRRGGNMALEAEIEVIHPQVKKRMPGDSRNWKTEVHDSPQVSLTGGSVVLLRP